MRPPLVALVGRPNVGKSTWFNRLVGERASLVDNQPGVTRDRIFGEAQVEGRLLRVVDTGGFDSNPDDPLLSRMREQTQLAIDEADLVLLVLDAIEGVRPADREVAQLLHKAGKPVAVLANKLDTPAHEEQHLAEAYELGLEPVIAGSAEHNRGWDALVDVFTERLEAPLVEEGDDQAPLAVAEETEEEDGVAGTRIEWPGGPIRVAVIGRPNVGKSSLINRLLGEERMLATDIAGTTRDAVDSELDREGQTFVFVDTAGIRRKRSIAERLEKFSVMSALRGLDRCDVALVVLDGAERPSDQDARVAALAHEKGKGIVLVANKWDLIENTEWKEGYPKAVRLDLPFVRYAPLLRLSAKTGSHVNKLFGAIMTAQQERHRRISTGELNRFFETVVERTPPTVYKGKRPRIYYVSQPFVRPPTFVFTASRPQHIPTTYARYLRNALRERYGFEGTPLWLKFRSRGKTARSGTKGGRDRKLTK